MNNGRLSITKDGFFLHGRPLRILSGAIHYFRVPRAYWEDRLLKLRACGFNTVETYIPWNLHEMREGVFDWDGEKDFTAFVCLAQRTGLYVILRPSPYICAEWDMGGLPWWLLTKAGIRLRCMNQPYLEAVDRYYDALMPRLVPLQSTHGGSVLMMQIENEYGSYGNDSEYLTYLATGMEKRGIDVPLFTSDGGTDFMLTAGTLPDYFKTVNFGSDAAGNFQKLREHQQDAPLMCTEFWNGWFSHWGEADDLPDAKLTAQRFRECLDLGASVSAYMFHGGTNFGLMNGANCDGHYQPTVSSYDYDAPLSEAGDYTEKYDLFRQALTGKDVTEELPPEQPKADYGCLSFTGWADLLDCRNLLAESTYSAAPLSMERLGQGWGLTLYHTHIKGPREEKELVIEGLHDRAVIFVNGTPRAVQYRNDKHAPLCLSVPKEGLDLDILVENMGHINYGQLLEEQKGITRGVRLGAAWLFGWDMWPLKPDDLPAAPFRENVPAVSDRPTMLRTFLTLSERPADTFIRLNGLTKGIVFVNGRCLGRYWRIGPQHSLYLPAPWLHEGDNEIIVLELEHLAEPEISFHEKP